MSNPPSDDAEGSAPFTVVSTEARFEVARLLGAGGMAEVYEAFDTYTKRRLALKRLQRNDDPKQQQRMVELFEREFYALSQISHPHVVEAYDYGVDQHGPFYTMELLEGAALNELAPLPWKRVCQIARDTCSALSLLHSRRLVYRDLNPRNIHCTRSGLSKLIDFGAIASMGRCAQIVGTPAFCAPEAVERMPLDARSDLYSLGATLYFALTGMHPHPIRSFAQVRQFWNSVPTRPSAVVPDIPTALDGLVMDLLNKDPAGRPANAGELLEQFAVIAGEKNVETLQVAAAYLSTPILVGRDAQLKVFRSKLQRAVAGKGCSLLIMSGSGMGRSRLLDAFQLQAKLAGALVVRAAGPTIDVDYGVIRVLARALLDGSPELAKSAASPYVTELSDVLPELSGAEPRIDQQLPRLDRPKLFAAMRDWWTAVARERPLTIVIDDFHGFDEPSAACIAWIARETQSHPLLIAVSCEAAAKVIAPAALKLYERTAVHLALGNLTAAETGELLRSVFGSVQHVRVLARKLRAIAAGNPRDTMRLAQDLVARGVVRYHSGAWSLPADFDEGELPDSMAQALLREYDALTPHARSILEVLSLATDRALGFEDFVVAFPMRSARVMRDGLQELLTRQFTKLESESEFFTVAHRGVHAATRVRTDSDSVTRLHAMLALIFSRRGNEQFRTAKHQLMASDTQGALDTLTEFAAASQALTDNDPDAYVSLVRSMPDDWLQVFDQAITCAEQLQRPPSEILRLRIRLSSLLNVMGASSVASRVHLTAIMHRLRVDCGLEQYAALDHQLAPDQRARIALAAAKQAYEHAGPEHRGYEPSLALRSLVRCEILAAGMSAIALDYELWTATPSIAAFGPLSPAIRVTENLLGAVGSRIAGRHERARLMYQAVIERTGRPDRAGLEPSQQRFLRSGVMYGLAAIEAGMGLASCLDWAKQLELEPLHRVNALQVHMLYELWQGRTHEADRMRDMIALRRLENSSRQMADGTHLLWQTVAMASSDDLTRLKQVIEELELFAARHAGWKSVAHYARAEYHRIRGDLAGALDELKVALAGLGAGKHQIWAHVAGAHVNVLQLLESTHEARTAGMHYLEEAESHELGYVINYVRMPLALALARGADQQLAVQLADQVIDSFMELGSTGLNLILAYETRCRVALQERNRTDYEHFAAACGMHCHRAGGQAVRAKLDRLLRAGRSIEPPNAEPSATDNASSVIEMTVRMLFDEKDEPANRARAILDLLMSSSGATKGALYLLSKQTPELVAEVGCAQDALRLRSAIAEFIQTQLDAAALDTASVVSDARANVLTSDNAREYVFILLSHQTLAGIEITGAAALVAARAKPFVHPSAIAAHISRMLGDSRDVVPTTTCDG